MKHYYAVESLGISAATNRRHCPTYMRFVKKSQRDEWVQAANNRCAIKSNDSDLRHELRKESIGWYGQEDSQELI
jgi:hypothetical protein